MIVFWIIIGVIATLSTSFSFIPQIIKTLRIKKVEDISPIMYIQLLIGAICWLSYGVYLGDWIIPMANGIIAISVLVILVLYKKYVGAE